MPNLVKFREDPDAMLVMSLEDYDEVTGKAAKAAIMHKDVVGPHAARHLRRHRRGRAAGLARPQAARSTCRSSPRSTASPRSRSSPSWATSSTATRKPKTWQTADAYLSGNVRAKLAAAEKRRAGLCPQRRGAARRAARGRAARRHRRQSRRAVDTRSRHPGVRRRALRRSRLRRSASAI